MEYNPDELLNGDLKRVSASIQVGWVSGDYSVIK